MTITTTSRMQIPSSAKAEKQAELNLVSTPLSLTQDKALQQAVRLLRSLPVEFAVMIDGEIIFRQGATLVASQGQKSQRRTRRANTYPTGAITRYIKPFIDPMKVGDVVLIPPGEFDLPTIRRSITAYASKLWGLQSYTSATVHTPTGETLYEILRTA